MGEHEAVIGLSIALSVVTCICCGLTCYTRRLLARHQPRYVAVHDLENPLLPPEDEGL